LLPDDVLWRKKEAFSDGVSGEQRSLYQILQDYCAKIVPEQDFKSYIDKTKIHPIMQKITNNFPKTIEQYYYRYIFESVYPGMGNVVPYFWMPKYIEATDASARTLSIYKYTENAENK
jgi:asparagine synthase (glutamine-hydrolysing)